MFQLTNRRAPWFLLSSSHVVKPLSVALTIALSSIPLLGCAGTGAEEQPNATTTEVHVLALATELPRCGNADRGLMYFVQSTGEFLFCDGNDYQVLDVVGRNSLIRQQVVPPGPSCELGGVRIETGVDADGNGQLDEAEVEQVSVLCAQLVEDDGCSGPGNCSDPDCAGTSCDDGDPCTQSDLCLAGSCVGTPYTCNDGLDCTQETCDGEGGCDSTVGALSCLVGGQCIGAGQRNPLNPCEVCAPGTDPYGWTFAEGAVCDDGDSCTSEDFCSAGVCVGRAYSCDDGVSCTSDVCDGDGGCSHPVQADSCLVDGACYAAGDSSPDLACHFCNPGVSQTELTFPQLGLACDGPDADFCEEGVWQCDLSGVATCSDDSLDTPETCGDGVDNDCDGATDEGCGL